MKKIDFKKEFKHLYNPSSKEVNLADVPAMNFLMIDGRGDPNNSKEFQDAVQALYGVTFTVKFALKKAKLGPEYTVPPLEGLWWMADSRPFDMQDKKSMQWTLMIMQPSHITKTHVADTIKKLSEKKLNEALSKIRLELFHEGLSAQIMHIGPYSAEGPTIEKLHNFVRNKGYDLRGRHHEIYLSDPRKSAPEKMKTILRHPIQKIWKN